MDIIKYNHHINAYKVYLYLLPDYNIMLSPFNRHTREVMITLYIIIVRLR